MPEAFATVREAAKRVLGQRHFDVQIMGGAALHLGNIAEMKTGEGKTLVSTLPAYLNALSGDGVHVVTVNDYLAKYHAEWMGRVHQFLGLTVGVILPEMTPGRAPRGLRRRHHLRHQQRARLRLPARQHGQLHRGVRPARPQLRDRRRGRLDPHRRGPHPADHLRPDAGRGPLVRRVRRPSRGSMVKDTDYEVDEKKRTISVLEPGITKVEDHLGIDNLYDSVNTPLISFMNNAIKAKELFRNDKEYVVLDGEVLIVDEHTGRMLAGRRYNEGLHQAIEAKEGVADPRGVPDPRHRHPAELLPALRQALRHDRHGDDRGVGVRQDLQARRGPDPDQQAAGPHRPARPRLPHRGGEVRRRRRRHRRAAPERPAGPRRHRLGREVRAAVRPAEAQGHPAHRAERQAARRARPRSSRSPATRARSPSPPTWPAEAPTSCSAARSSSSPTRSCATQGLDPLEDGEAYERGLARRRSSGSSSRSRPSTTRSRRPAASTSSAPSATSRAASTTSCAVGPAVRATRASPGSTCRSRTS